MKKLRYKIYLKLSAIFDIIFADKFELTTYNQKTDVRLVTTKYWKQEIDDKM